MTNIFGTTQQYKPTQFVTADKMLLRVGGQNNPAAEFLIQDISIQFNRPVAPLFEIGTSNTYFAPGRAMGQMSIQRIIGAKRITDVLGQVGQGIWSTEISQDELEDAGARTITLTEISTAKANPLSFKITGAMIESYGATTNASGLLMQESVSIRFADLQFGGEDVLTELANQAISTGVAAGTTLGTSTVASGIGSIPIPSV